MCSAPSFTYWRAAANGGCCSVTSWFYGRQLNCLSKTINGLYKWYDSGTTFQTWILHDAIAFYILPDEVWPRRISGVFGNELANQNPARGHAILSYNGQGGYQISVRAPLISKIGAGELCSLFTMGGGRKSAAGINHLTLDQLAVFIKVFEQKYH